jgi:hypothetical protein
MSQAQTAFINVQQILLNQRLQKRNYQIFLHLRRNWMDRKHDDDLAIMAILSELVGTNAPIEINQWLLQTFINDEMLVSGVPYEKIPRWTAPQHFTMIDDASTLYHILLVRFYSDHSDSRRFKIKSFHHSLTWVLRALFGWMFVALQIIHYNLTTFYFPVRYDILPMLPMRCWIYPQFTMFSTKLGSVEILLFILRLPN